MVAGGVVAALAAVLLYAVSTVLQVVAARRAVASGPGDLAARDLAGQPVWWLAIGLLALAFLAFVVSTRVLPLPMAEALRSGYLAVAVALGHMVFRTRPTAWETVGVTLSLIGLTLFVAGGGQRGRGVPDVGLAAAMIAVLAGVLAADVLLARIASRRPQVSGAVEAGLAGLAFAVLDMGVRALPDPFSLSEAVTRPACWVGALGAPLGLLLFSRAAARTSVAVATTLMLVVDVVAAAGWAAVAFGDSLSGGPILLAAAVASMGTGTLLVAKAVPVSSVTSPPIGATQAEAEPDLR